MLALGAGSLLLLGLRWKIESGKNDDPSVLPERSVTKDGASRTNGIPVDASIRSIERDKRWKWSVRSDDGESSRWIFRANATLLAGSSRRDQRLMMITQIDGRSNLLAVETRIPEARNKEDGREERPVRRETNDPTVDTSPTLRHDRSVKDIVGGTESRWDRDHRRVSRISDDVSRSARDSGSRQPSINADNDLRSSAGRRARDSEDDDDRRGVPSNASSDDDDDGGAAETSRSTSEERPRRTSELSAERRFAARMDDGGARRYAAGMREDQLLFFRDDRERVRSSAMSPAERIGDRKDLPGKRDREADPARGRRGLTTGGDWFTRASNRSRRFRGRDDGIATRRTDDNGARRERILQDKSAKVAASNARRPEHSIVDPQRSGSIERNDASDGDRREIGFHTGERRIDPPIDDEGDAPSGKDPSDNVDNELPPDRIGLDEESSEHASTFGVFDSVIPLDNKRRKVTRGEDSKDLMIISNFVWTSQEHRTSSKILIPEDLRPIFSREKPRRDRSRDRTFLGKKRARSIGAEAGRRIDKDGGSSSAIIREAMGDRRKRYANYYSAQSATPMAYVHIQPAYPPAYPVAPPSVDRKCGRCMVVYKPCPLAPRPPPRIVLPSYRYHEPAAKWRGLKYGESRSVGRHPFPPPSPSPAGGIDTRASDRLDLDLDLELIVSARARISG